MNAKKPKHFGITFGTEDRWTEIPVVKEEKGYFAGIILVGDIKFHVEAIEVEETELSNSVVMEAVNPAFQNRIDKFGDINEGLAPTLLEQGHKKYFINVEPFAQ
jgi:CBS domain-containing protein